MSRTCSILALCLLAVPARAAAPVPLPKLDRLGDPLPLSALARFGTARLRHGGPISLARFSPDGKRVVSFDGVVRTWDAATGKQLAAGPPLGRPGSRIALSPDCRLIAVEHFDDGRYDQVAVFDVATGRRVLLLSLAGVAGRRGHFVDGLTFSPDSLLLAASEGGRTRVWEVPGGRTVCTTKVEGHDMTGLAFSPDGKTVAACNDLRVLFVDVATGAVRATEGREGLVPRRLVFSPDGKALAVGYGDGTVRLWDARAVESSRTFTLGVAFCHD